MTVKLTEDQVMDIHLGYHGNGGDDRIHTLCKRHDITINECYSVLRISLKTALRKANKGHKFVSWDPEKHGKLPKTKSISSHHNARMYSG